jgi:hypothetical protein
MKAELERMLTLLDRHFLQPLLKYEHADMWDYDAV